MYRGKYEAARQKQPASVKQEQGNVEAPQKDQNWDGTIRPPQRRKKKKLAVGKLVFYGIWLLLIVAFIIGMSIAMKALRKWLVDFEATQPDNMSQKIYQTHFQSPDWQELYELGDIADTVYEGQDAYVAYMEQTVADKEITMVETSAGLTGGKKYVLRAALGEDKFYNFATFTMVDKKQEGALISDWQLGKVELFTLNSDDSMSFRRDKNFRFLLLPDSTVTVNGIGLDDSHVIRRVSTVAEGYLPEGIHGYRLVELELDGLLMEPQIQILKADGTAAQVEFDAESCTYLEQIPEQVMTEEERSTVVSAAKTYCQYMIGALGAWDLRSYFDHTTQIYTTITTNTTWMQGYQGYDFGPETVTDFYRYSDSLYSAKVTVDLNVVRPDGTVKVYALSTTFFLQLQDAGWKVIEMTNVDVQAQNEQVRFTFVADDQVLATQMVEVSAKKVTPPQVTAPEGQSLRGWFVQAGKLEQDADGNILIPADFAMEPMTVYSLFGNGEG